MIKEFCIHNIHIINQRLDAAHTFRVNRTLSTIGPIFQKIYNLVPIFFHYHHPLIPGYVENKVPYGINLFTPDKNQYQLLLQLIGNSKLKSPKHEMPITGIYSMGSTFSIGQNDKSDLDIWVFHKSHLDKHDLINLNYKCTRIQKWCNSLSIKISFFLIDENIFKYCRVNCFSKQKINSIYNVFLLDEFYRTSVRIAGKRILWTVIPDREEYRYEEYVYSLYSDGILTQNEWLDLGNLKLIQIKEYFKEILLQINKNANTPYKSLLKISLIESYVLRYPHTELLSMYTKKHLHSGNIIFYGFDPYYIMLNRLTNYLTDIKDNIRLNLIRCCFYFKVKEKLSIKINNQQINWKRKILLNLVRHWGWDEEKLKILDQNIDYKKKIINEINNELLKVKIKNSNKLIGFLN
ncbi:hypothetical protein CRV12_03570 [Candidatus Pantoea edessiphila]|uniref:Adenylate cyclase class-I N-terminal domain-containing protein n=1 Tax=Candidatus Pantoea edessiphila TaxID=2044610 RepID=A0A2P5SZ97_9GAMM|nr:class I adenylate cyclase [Candidatus Pantoea edessiphila]PPI87668.1 hypothetical protein CRV12_03570 [Candidatus Pantoea edessiphila]